MELITTSPNESEKKHNTENLLVTIFYFMKVMQVCGK